MSEQNLELLYGATRGIILLGACVVAARAFARVGAANLAIDGLIAIAAVFYVGLASCDAPLLGAAIAMIVATGLATGVGAVSLARRVEMFVFSLGILFLLRGASQFICWLFSDTANQMGLKEAGVGSFEAFIGVCALIGIYMLLTRSIAGVRLAKALGADARLSAISGRPTTGPVLFNSAVGGAICGAVGVLLATWGGAFTPDISQQRGILAVAIVGLVRTRLFWCVLVVVLFGVSEKLVTKQDLAPMLRSQQFQMAIPFIVGLVVVCGTSWLRSRKVRMSGA